MNKRKICVVTGSRAEYGLLYWLMKDIQADDQLELQIVATGMHLSPEFGLTHKAIEQDGFTINEKVEMLLSSDTSVGIAKSIGLGVIGFADSFGRLSPHIVVLLGDRFETFAAAQAALVSRIPIAHIAGGDITEGAVDEAIRHSISKMSQLHFVTNKLSAKRVRQLGENPDYIFNVGSPGLDNIRRLKLLNRRQLEEKLNFCFRGKNLLVTFHPVTLDEIPSSKQMQELLDALSHLDRDTGIIFTGSNADAEGRQLNQMVKNFVETHPNAVYYQSLGQLLYLSAVSQVDMVVGNSSSGLYEAPSFKKPTVNIGDRQQRRLQAESVINCPPDARKIEEAIKSAYRLDCSQVENPYGDGNSSQRIIKVLKGIDDYAKLLKKPFFEVSCSE